MSHGRPFGLATKEKMKLPIPGSNELLDQIKQALTPKRFPLLIAIDGADGIGKSSLASWLAWQLGMPATRTGARPRTRTRLRCGGVRMDHGSHRAIAGWSTLSAVLYR
jgi:predicted GTPase